MPVRRLRSAANIHSLHFEMACCGGEEAQEVIRTLWRYIASMPGWDVIDLPYILPDGPLAELTSVALNSGMLVEQRESWRALYISLKTDRAEGEPWSRTSTGQFRKKIARRWRQLEALGPLVLRRVHHYDPDALQRFYDLERSGWKGAAGTAIDCDPVTSRFYDLIAREAARFGYLSLYSLESCGRPVAAQFGFTCHGRYFLAKAAYDEQYSQYGPGHLLVLAVLRDCWERGVGEFDFLGPWMEDEAHWAKESRVVGHAWVFRRGFYGRLLHSIEFPIKNSVNKLLAMLVSEKTSARLKSFLAPRGELL
jgi:CelD/BcsL family acetyltransferase involved in cellulose biosynthesis